MKLHADKPFLFAAAFAALAAAPAAAQVADIAGAYQAAAVSAAASAKSGAAAAAPSSCDDAKELETPFELVFTPADGSPKLTLRFEYAGCDWEPRNDYLPPYTERDYEAPGGYGLVITTNDGDSASEVLLSKGKDWIGNLGSPANDALASGDPVAVDVTDHEIWNKSNGRATLRNAAKPLYPELKKCEAVDWSKAALSAPARENGEPALGWDGRSGPSLVLLTKTAAYYYHEDCDICAALTRCELSTGALSDAVTAHSVDCSDMKPYRTADAVYDACAEAR